MRKSIFICLIFLWTVSISAQTNPIIINFTYDGIALIYDEVEQGIAAADFSWEALHVDAPYRMQMHAFVGGQWVLIGEDFEPAKSDRLVIAHPLSFSMPSYRLSIVDADDHIVDEAHLRLPYADTDPDGQPEIVSFDAEATSVSRQALINGTARIPVSWEVANRTSTTNLIFEQVLPNGDLHSIELPRFEDWVRSVGEGVIAPVNVAGENSLRLQISVVDIVTGELLTTNQIVLAIDNDVVRSVPTTTPIPALEAPLWEQITFDVPSLVTLGSDLTLRWDASAAIGIADEILIREWHQIDYTGAYGEIPFLFEDDSDTPAHEWANLPLSGEITVEAPSDFLASNVSHNDYQNVIIFALYLRVNGDLIIRDELFMAQSIRPVYLRTLEDATTCVPSIQIPEQVTMDEDFDISWDLCGVPTVQIAYGDNAIVWGLHPRFTPTNPSNNRFRVSLYPEQTEANVTFTISSSYSDAQVEGTVRVVRP